MADEGESKKVAVQQIQRRTWDVDEYQRKADEKAAERQLDEEQTDEAAKKTFSGTVIKRESLKRRDADLQIEKMVGKSLVVSSTSALNAQGGYYCKVCDCTVKDSMSWLDHVNGKKHNRNMGMSMRVERATLEDVQSKMKQYKPSDRKNEAKPGDERSAIDDLDARIDRLREEEERERGAKREAKKAKKAGAEEANKADVPDGFMDMMGFGGFGTSKGGNKK